MSIIPIICIELLLSHKYILNQFDKEDLYKLLKESVRKYDEKRMLPNIYSNYSLFPTSLICLNIITNDKFDSQMRNKIIERLKSKHTYDQKITFIINQSKKYLK